MLNAIRQFFDKNIKPVREDTLEAEQHHLQVATAALLIEMMRMDFEVKEEERQTVVKAIRSKFEMTHEETEVLMQLAKAEARKATDYYQFTSLINKGFTPEQKEKVIEYMWQVAYADGEVDKYEDHLVRKIANLIHVPHSAFIAAKHRARSRIVE